MVAGRTAWSAGYFLSHSSATSANAGAIAGFWGLSNTDVSPSNSFAAIFVAAASASFLPRSPGPARFALRRPWWSTKTHHAPFHSLTFTPTLASFLVVRVHFTRSTRLTVHRVCHQAPRRSRITESTILATSACPTRRYAAIHASNSDRRTRISPPGRHWASGCPQHGAYSRS